MTDYVYGCMKYPSNMSHRLRRLKILFLDVQNILGDPCNDIRYIVTPWLHINICELAIE